VNGCRTQRDGTNAPSGEHRRPEGARRGRMAKEPEEAQ